jgi:hypothetical protein
MVDDIISVFTLALIVTALGITLSHGSAAANVITSTFNGFAGIQRAAAGN